MAWIFQVVRPNTLIITPSNCVSVCFGSCNMCGGEERQCLGLNVIAGPWALHLPSLSSSFLTCILERVIPTTSNCF